MAGPVASFFAAGVFWSIEPLPDGGGVLGALAGINLAVAVINLLPTPITDGGASSRGLFGWTLRWRHMAVAWVLLELEQSCAVSAVGTWGGLGAPVDANRRGSTRQVS